MKKNLTTQQKVKLLFEEVQNRKLAIEKAERPCWKTSGNFGYSADSAHNRISIPTITDVRKLVDILSFLIERKEKTEMASKELGVDYNFTWLGFTLDEWKDDLLTRSNQLKIQEKRKELAEYEARLSMVITPELRAEMEVEFIENALNKK